MRWQHTLTQAWLHKGWLARSLWPLASLFGALVQLRQWLYRQGWLTSHRLPVPVIVVGNVVTGGVGKTPVVMALADYLSSRGWQVGVISRGYGRCSRDVQEVFASSLATEVGDEPLLIAQKCRIPVFVAPQRVDAAQALLHAHPQVQIIVCDDGLQHMALARDLELCVFDERDTGNGWLLPAGPLREAWPRRQNPQVPCFELKTFGVAQPHQFAVHRRLDSQAQQADGTRRALQDFSNTDVQAVAGIAKPEVFFDMLRQQGLKLVHTYALADHASLQSLPLKSKDLPLLCTEKDAVKLWSTLARAWAVPLVCELPANLCQAIDRVLQSLSARKL